VTRPLLRRWVPRRSLVTRDNSAYVDFRRRHRSI